MILRLKILLLSLLTSHVVVSQTAIGDWDYYGAYGQMQVMAFVGNKAYVANENGAFFVYDDATKEVTKLTKQNGFVDTRISYLEYGEEENILVITYINGQIDLLKGNQILNVNDIYRNENISGSKRINHVSIRGQYAYLGTDFGVVVLNITTGLIKETYRFIGAEGAEVEVYSSSIKDSSDSLFIVSNEGVQTASLNSANLQDFTNWTIHDESNQLPAENLVDVAVLNAEVFLATEKGLYSLEGSLWVENKMTDNEVVSLVENANELTMSYADTVLKVKSKTDFEPIVSSLLNKANLSRVSTLGEVYATDSANGLVVINSTSNNYLPSGPAYSDAFRIKYFNDKIVVLSGGYSTYSTPFNSDKGFYEYTDLMWSNFISGKDFPTMLDFVTANYSRVTDVTYYGSVGSGLLQRKGEQFTLYDETNSILDSSLNGKVNVGDVQVDEQGLIWLSNYYSWLNIDEEKGTETSVLSTSLIKIDVEGDWTAYKISNTEVGAGLEFVIDNFDVKWIQTGTGDLLAFDPETGEDKLLTTSSGGLPDNVSCLDINKAGEIFIGTENGVAVIYNPQEVFTDGSFSVTKPIFGDQFLLKDEVINALKIDGGGRMWVGTKNGLFLYNEDLSEQLMFFNSKNSPMLSNEVLSIGIDGGNGEVFVSTEFGLFAFMGYATDAGDKNEDNITIFPNPVLPNFGGVVAIRGLVSDANVKITDINANIVHETDAEGGTAVWDLKLLSGERVTTGVYLVFTSDEDGKETFVGQIAVISQ